MTDFEMTRAPWTSEQVDALNKYQRSGMFHPFTCPNHSEMADTDRSLFATKNGWVCPHCDYQQDWAHAAMLTAPERMIVLPCDVMLPPATLIRKGCDYAALLTGLNARVGRPPEDCRFNDPASKPALLRVEGEHPVKVSAGDYQYEGRLAGFAIKRSGAVRYVVEDQNRRLFIHNHIQIGVEEGWMPDQSK